MPELTEVAIAAQLKEIFGENLDRFHDWGQRDLITAFKAGWNYSEAQGAVSDD